MQISIFLFAVNCLEIFTSNNTFKKSTNFKKITKLEKQSNKQKNNNVFIFKVSILMLGIWF